MRWLGAIERVTWNEWRVMKKRFPYRESGWVWEAGNEKALGHLKWLNAEQVNIAGVESGKKKQEEEMIKLSKQKQLSGTHPASWNQR